MYCMIGLVTAKSTIVGPAWHSSTGFCACHSAAAATHYGTLLLLLFSCPCLDTATASWEP